MTLSSSDLDKKEEGAFIIVGKAPGMPWWEWVLTDNPNLAFQEVKDPKRADPPLVFLYKEEAEECLDRLLEIKLQRGLMQGAELKIISLEDIHRPILQTNIKPPEWYKDL
jgi:hypothetical protein